MADDPRGSAPDHGRRSARLARALRDGWLVLGITLLFAVVLDLGVRAALGVNHWLKTAPERQAAALHPYAHETWYAEWQKHGWPVTLPRSYDAYRAWRMSPVSVPGIHVDANGVRLTEQPPPHGTPRRVLMLGGSVMWGYTVRDGQTIPSLVAKGLQARGVDDVEVVNLAQPAYVTGQEIETLLLDLRNGDTPAAVVFLDGVNDVAAAAEWGEAGHIYFERDLERRMRAGSGTVGGILAAIAQSSAIAEALGPRLAQLRRAASPVPAAVCQDVADQYWRQVRAVDALGREYSFSSLFVWQPSLATTRKPLTQWERAVRSDHPLVQLIGPCTDLMIAAAPQHHEFLSLRGIFDREQSSVFLDQWGHVTEQANAAIAAAITERLAEMLAGQHPGASTGRGPGKLVHRN